jgi:hypothetical protein
MIAQVLKVTPCRKRSSYSIMLLKDIDTQQQYSIFAFDTAYALSLSLPQGALIKGDIKDSFCAATGKHYPKMTYFSIYEPSCKGTITGVVGSLDVHEKSGKGNQLMSFKPTKMDNENCSGYKKLKKIYVTIPRNGFIARETRKGDIITLEGVVDVNIKNNRHYISKFSQLTNDTTKRLYEGQR